MQFSAESSTAFTASPGDIFRPADLRLQTSIRARYNTTMTLPLTDQIRHALADHPGEPVELVDEGSQARYVLVPGEQFDCLRALLVEDEFDLRETYKAQSQALGKAGWDDPAMDIYNDYDANKLLVRPRREG